MGGEGGKKRLLTDQKTSQSNDWMHGKTERERKGEKKREKTEGLQGFLQFNRVFIGVCVSVLFNLQR